MPQRSASGSSWAGSFACPLIHRRAPVLCDHSGLCLAVLLLLALVPVVLLAMGLTTIGLTIPVVLIISLVTNDLVILGLDPESMVLIAISVLLLKSNLDSSRTNILMGAMHMVLFASYVALIFM